MPVRPHTVVSWPQTGWRSRSGAGRCGSRIRAGSTSRRGGRPSSTWSGITCRSVTASCAHSGSGRACCTGSRPAWPGRRCTRSGCPPGAPPWLETVRVHFPRYGRHADELCVTELAEVIWAVQMSTVEFHPWNSRRADTERPDEWRIDLDPGPTASSPPCAGSPTWCSEMLDELGVTGWPKTSGGNGLHVYVRIEPRWGFAELRRAAHAFALEVERRAPGDVTTTWWRKDRDPARCSSTTTRTPATTRSPARIRSAACLRRSCPRRSRGARSTRSSPRECTIATVPARFAELGDLHAGHRRRGVPTRAAAGVGGSRRVGLGIWGPG